MGTITLLPLQVCYGTYFRNIWKKETKTQNSLCFTFYFLSGDSRVKQQLPHSHQRVLCWRGLAQISEPVKAFQCKPSKKGSFNDYHLHLDSSSSFALYVVTLARKFPQQFSQVEFVIPRAGELDSLVKLLYSRKNDANNNWLSVLFSSKLCLVCAVISALNHFEKGTEKWFPIKEVINKKDDDTSPSFFKLESWKLRWCNKFERCNQMSYVHYRNISSPSINYMCVFSYTFPLSCQATFCCIFWMSRWSSQHFKPNLSNLSEICILRQDRNPHFKVSWNSEVNFTIIDGNTKVQLWWKTTPVQRCHFLQKRSMDMMGLLQ